jgi:RNA polymerase sigma-70 factor (ECF subfamily)
MKSDDLTCWTLIHAAADGDTSSRERFAKTYLPVVRTYLAARWRARPDSPAIDDAVQDVFVECFKPGGVLAKAEAERDGGFRAYLLGVVRNVARKKETRTKAAEPLPDSLPADDTSVAKAFDRAWVKTMLRQAAKGQADTAKGHPAAERRVELLRLRFQEGLPIRDIAERWGEDPAKLHHEYATARAEFREALIAVARFHAPHATPAEVEETCQGLLGMVG